MDIITGMKSFEEMQGMYRDTYMYVGNCGFDSGMTLIWL